MRNPSWTPLVLLLLCSTAGAADLSDQQMEDFLLHARVVRTREATVGVTRSLHATLERGELIHDAQIQRIDQNQADVRTAAPVRDFWGFNIAAYRLDRLLGLHMIPVAVERAHAGKPGAFSWWLDDVRMMERQRWQERIQPPDLRAWNEQIHTARVFNELVYNADANLSNILILNDWSIRLIDYTRAFGPSPDLRKPTNLLRISRRLLRALRELEPAAVREACRPYLTPAEVGGLLERRDRIVQIFDQKIAEKGEDAILFGEP